MTVTQIRFIKALLLVMLIVSAAYVGYYLRAGMTSRTRSTTELPDEPTGITSRQVELEQLDSDGKTAFTLTAAESVGKTESGQQFKEVEIHFGAGADDTPVVVTADHCEVRRDNSVRLEGSVVVRDDTTLRLEADELEFRRFPDRVWSTKPVRYFREGLVGDAGNMSYVMKRGDLELDEGVDMTIQRGSGAPVRITSKSASMRRNRNWIQYVDRVQVRQGQRDLSCNDLQLFLNEGNDEIERVEAYEKVVLRMRITGDDVAPSEEVLSTSVSSEPGLRRLDTEHLEMILRPGGEKLERVRALEGGRVQMKLPEDTKKGFHKEIEGHLLAFEFDEAGELSTFRGRGGVTLTLKPAEKGKETKIVRSRLMEADFDPVSGEIVEARCSRAVSFEQGDVRATAGEGVFRAPESQLVLTEAPRLWDPRANLEAERIEIDVDSGDVQGIRDVRSSSAGEARATGLFSSTDREPVHFVADHLAYDRAEEIAVYTGSARGFQAQSRVEAETIRLFQRAGDLQAEGSVRTVFFQELTEDDAKEPKPTVTRAATLHYRAEAEVLEYREGVEMEADEMTLHGDRVDVNLTEGSKGVAELYAEGEVEIETSDGRAAGDNARYLPKDQSMTINGERAWLENAGKRTEGKQLTFFLTDDRILVDGQEQTRTKTTYSSKPRPF